ncbi:MAG: glycosyltransferase family 2 protein [Elusimicrobiota bacterium]
MPDREPYVSVVVACHNYAGYVGQALRSALSQTFQDLEVVVVNDGSTDGFDGAFRPFASEPRVRRLDQARAGQANAKNNGVRASRGSLIAFLDADDAWEPSKLDKQLKLFADPRVGVVYCRKRDVGHDGSSVVSEMGGLRPRRGRVFRHLLLDNFVPFSSSVVRRQCLESADPFDESLEMSIDWDLWLRLSADWDFDYVDEPLVLYRRNHPGQMSKNLTTRQKCCDRIYEKVAAAAPLARADLRRARTYTLNSRGYYHRARDPRTAIRHYRDSLRENPFQWTALKGLALSCLVRRPKSAEVSPS